MISTVHKNQVHCSTVVLCSDENSQFTHVRCFACLQRQVEKLACRLFYCWTLLRNDEMETNFHVFTSSYGNRRFASCECSVQVMQARQ